MSPLKTTAIKMIQSLPDDCTMEQIQSRLGFIEKIERARKEKNEGAFVSEEEADQEIDQWLQSDGTDQP